MKPFMIAITGGTGSGKSTLANALAARLASRGCALLTEDNYYLPRADHTPPVVGWANEDIERTINFDDPATKDMAMFRGHLVDLREGRSIRQPVYDFETHERRPEAYENIDPSPFLIVEGVHVLADPGFGSLFDLTIFVEAAEDIRLIRRLRRDRDERGRDVERTIRQYLSFVRAAHLRFTEPAKYICDLVVADEGETACRNDGPDEEAIAKLVAPVWARLERVGALG